MSRLDTDFNFRARIIFAGVVVGLCFGVVVLRAMDLMVLDGPRFRKMAQRQHQRVEKLVPRRGAILDRNGRVLADSVLVDSLYAHPRQVNDPAATAKILAPILREPAGELLKMLASDKHFVWLKRSMSPEQATEVRRSALDGVVTATEYARYYPEGSMAANIIGFSGIDGVGLEGIEMRFNQELAGEELKFVVERDARGKSIYPDPDALPISKGGDRLYLTIDVRIQQIVEEALDDLMERTDPNFAMVAVMEVSTGKILALAIRPTFNPNEFVHYPAANYRNRMVMDIFEPGSTFKAFTFAALLDTGTMKRYDELFCEDGAFELDGSIINDTSPHGWFTAEEIIVHSSNIGAAKMGLKLGREKFGDYIARFGFGKTTGIDLPAENSGLVRPMKKISRVGVANVAFGHGIGVTGIQMLAAFNALANGGVWIQPTIIERIEDHDGNVLTRPKPSSHRVISAASAAEETKVLINVIHGGGTGGHAAPSGYRAAGKTGTAQKVDLQKGGYFEDKYVASFLGFVPADRPEITILVVADDPKGDPWGGVVAAPAFRMIAERALPVLGILPKDSGKSIGEMLAMDESSNTASNLLTTSASPPPAGAISPSPLPPFQAGRQEDCADCMPNLIGMTLRQILVTAARRGVKIEVSGSGRVTAQKPQPGTKTTPESQWWVRLDSDPY